MNHKARGLSFHRLFGASELVLGYFSLISWPSSYLTVLVPTLFLIQTEMCSSEFPVGQIIHPWFLWILLHSSRPFSLVLRRGKKIQVPTAKSFWYMLQRLRRIFTTYRQYYIHNCLLKWDRHLHATCWHWDAHDFGNGMPSPFWISLWFWITQIALTLVSSQEAVSVHVI